MLMGVPMGHEGFFLEQKFLSVLFVNTSENKSIFAHSYFTILNSTNHINNLIFCYCAPMPLINAVLKKEAGDNPYTLYNLSFYYLPSGKLFLAASDTSSVPRMKTACLWSSLLRCTWKGVIPSSLYLAKSQFTSCSSQYLFN